MSVTSLVPAFTSSYITSYDEASREERSLLSPLKALLKIEGEKDSFVSHHKVS